jgi:hypothetical protein
MDGEPSPKLNETGWFERNCWYGALAAPENELGDNADNPPRMVRRRRQLRLFPLRLFPLRLFPLRLFPRFLLLPPRRCAYPPY